VAEKTSTKVSSVGAKRSVGGFVRRTEPTPTKVYDTYWRFACARQSVYFERLKRSTGPWTEDPILARNRFTNVYRAADRVSQYLIRNVIYGSQLTPEETIFRVLLFKVFNKIETWELLEERFGVLTSGAFDLDKFDLTLSKAMADGRRIYSAAYIMPPARQTSGTDSKHRTHLELLRYILSSHVDAALRSAKSLRELFSILISLPGLGPFLAYQFSIDLAYSPVFSFSEDDFVQPGPGALNGLAKCFVSLGEYSPSEAIEWVKDRQEAEFERLGLQFRSLWGRRLHLIDCQNVFCEVDKYARVAHPEVSGLTNRFRIKQRFDPKGALPTPWFPPKWNLQIPGPDDAAVDADAVVNCGQSPC
jgi:hypothetical protein